MKILTGRLAFGTITNSRGINLGGFVARVEGGIEGFKGMGLFDVEGAEEEGRLHYLQIHAICAKWPPPWNHLRLGGREGNTLFALRSLN